MDPETALRESLIALFKGDRSEAVLHLSSLATWLEKGGFMPREEEVDNAIKDAIERGKVTF